MTHSKLSPKADRITDPSVCDERGTISPPRARHHGQTVRAMMPISPVGKAMPFKAYIGAKVAFPDHHHAAA
jgi:hypothetical protein